MPTLEDFQAFISHATGTAAASVVGVAARRSRGSGVVIAQDRVLTNAHNLRGNHLEITLPDGSRVTGSARGVDLDGDLAVVAAPTGDARPIEWSDATADAGIGYPVVALANPGGAGLRATFGHVSGVQRTFRGPRGSRIAGSFEHTAPLLPGSSGGPVVDRDGHLLGLNTNRLGEGFYLAIPADEALRSRVDALAAGQSPERPRLGVGVAPSVVARKLRRAVGLPDADGLLIRVVEEGSPADLAGLQEGDLLTTLGGEAVTTVDGLHDLLGRVGTGEVDVTWLRGADEHSATVTLPAAAA